MTGTPEAVLTELRRRAVAKYGDRVSLRPGVFVVDGLRVFVGTRTRGGKCGVQFAGGEWDWGESYERLMGRLDAAIGVERSARNAISETGG